MSAQYQVGDRVSMVIPRDCIAVWWDRIRLLRWNVPQTERIWFRCTDTSPGSIWPQDFT